MQTFHPLVTPRHGDKPIPNRKSYKYTYRD